MLVKIGDNGNGPNDDYFNYIDSLFFWTSHAQYKVKLQTLVIMPNGAADHTNTYLIGEQRPALQHIRHYDRSLNAELYAEEGNTMDLNKVYGSAIVSFQFIILN